MNGGQFLEDNYKELTTMSKRWGGSDWSELLSYYTIWLNKNWFVKMNPIPHVDQMRFSQSWLKNNSKWWNSEFNKLRAVNNNAGTREEDDEFGFDESQIVDDDERFEYNDMIELNAEPLPDDIKSWIIDIHSNFSEVESEKIIKIRSIYLQLPTHEKVLYDLYFTNMLTMRQIGHKLDLPLTSVFMMINELKEKIKGLV